MTAANSPQVAVPAAVVHPSDEMTDHEQLRRKRNIDEVEPTELGVEVDRVVHQRKRSRETDPRVIQAAMAACDKQSPTEDRVDEKDDQPEQVQEVQQPVDTKAETVGIDEPDAGASDKQAESSVSPPATNTVPPPESADQPEPAEGEGKSDTVPKDTKPESKPSKNTSSTVNVASPFASVTSGSTSNNFFMKPNPSSGPAVASPFGSLGTNSSSAFGSSGLAWGFSNPTPTATQSTTESTTESTAFKPPKPFGAPPSDDEEENDDDDASCDSEDDELRAEARRLADAQHTTGEENEETVYRLEAKFFVLVKDKGAPSWVERCTGIVKLNKSVLPPGTEVDDGADSDAEGRTKSDSGDSDGPVGSEGATSIDGSKEPKEDVGKNETSKETPEPVSEPVSDPDTKVSADEKKPEPGATVEDDAASEKISKGEDDSATPLSSNTTPTIRARLLMRSHKALHVSLNCQLNKALRYGDVKGNKPTGALFYFMWPQGDGKYDVCLLKAAVPAEAVGLWTKVKEILAEM